MERVPASAVAARLVCFAAVQEARSSSDSPDWPSWVKAVPNLSANAPGAETWLGGAATVSVSYSAGWVPAEVPAALAHTPAPWLPRGFNARLLMSPIFR